jgi:hypothetical protein
MLTQEQLSKLKSDYGFEEFRGAKPTENTGKASDFLDVAKSTLSNIANSAKEGISKFGEGYNQIKEGVNNPSTFEGLQQIGKGILHEAVSAGETLMSPVTGTIKTGIDAIPEDTKKSIGATIAPVSKAYNEVINGIGDYFGSSEALQKFVANNPDAEQVVKDLRDSALAVLGTDKGVDAVKSAIEKSVETLAKTKPLINTIKEGTQNLISKGSEAIPMINKTVNLAKDATTGILNKGKQVIENVGINAENKIATERLKKSFPEAQQSAIRAGVEMQDAQKLGELSLKGNTKAQELLNSVKEANLGKAVDPREVVGSEMIKAIKTAESKAKSIGTKLSAESKNLGNVTHEELLPSIFKRLEEKLPGIKLGADGTLDFTETALQSGLSKADQGAIQTAFRESTAGGTGIAKHKLRQNYFETLDGAKRSLTNLNASLDNALQGIRTGLLDVLESKNPVYRKLSKRFAETIKPVTNIRKIVKATTEEGDIMNMKAGILSRRLTSNAPSGADLRDALRGLDKVVGLSSEKSVTQLQDLLDVLGKYYNIEKANSFKGLSKGALNESNVVGMVKGLVGDIASETPVVRQKAIEKLISSLMK